LPRRSLKDEGGPLRSILKTVFSIIKVIKIVKGIFLGYNMIIIQNASVLLSWYGKNYFYC
jgi:hypothetical protein